MDEFQKEFNKENEYLENTLEAIRQQLGGEQNRIRQKRETLTALRRDMWDNAVHLPRDFSAVADISHYRTEVQVSTKTYENSLQKIEKLHRMLGTPYFGRFDFRGQGTEGEEKIYVGRYTLTDPKTYKMLVYDWRAPICSVYYRHELGPAEYETPSGLYSGEVILKRQYQIKDSKLLNFFDSSVVITDDMLIDILNRNASPKMRSIVESIQKEQDIIIRDTKSPLLVVQGAAGSGKTSIALHRIAYLLYEGLGGSLTPRNIIIVSPNEVFSRYISNVLPDLGEENVDQLTFERIALKGLRDHFAVETRAQQMERLIGSGDHSSLESVDFKGSETFVRILDRLIRYYEHQVLSFEDVYYSGMILAARQQLKSRFLNNRKNVPMARRARRIEEDIWEAVRPLRKQRLKQLESIVQKSEGHDLEIKSFSRLLSIKETNRLKRRLQKFTQIEFPKLYEFLFSDRERFLQLAAGLKLPSGIDRIISQTRANLKEGKITYEDSAPLLYLKMKVEGINPFPWVKQVVIDEAQDYSPMQYHVFKGLFRGADYTVLGDVNQSMERDVDLSIYEEVVRILDKPEAVRLTLSKTYRSTWEINAFNRKLLGGGELPASFERHGEEPRMVYKETLAAMDEAVTKEIDGFLAEGFESVAVVCKTQEEAKKVYARLRKKIPLRLVGQEDHTVDRGAVVISTYMAKGLEFDAVLVYGTGKENYASGLDKRLLYIACTRALHRLVLYYTGENNPWMEARAGESPGSISDN